MPGVTQMVASNEGKRQIRIRLAGFNDAALSQVSRMLCEECSYFFQLAKPFI